MEGVLLCLKAAVEDWNNVDFNSRDNMNLFIEKHESTLITFGMFPKGLRIIPVKTEDLQNSFHRTPDGIRGILSMNIEILRRRVQ